jgi:aminopeptidase C
MIKAGQPVFFGCDVGQFSVTTAGIMDTALYKYEVCGLYLPSRFGYSLTYLIYL